MSELEFRGFNEPHEHLGTFYENGWQPPLSGLTVEHAQYLIRETDIYIDEHETQATIGSWWLADQLVWAEDNLGDAFSQITPDPSKSRRSYLMLMRIARAFPERERRYQPDQMSIWAHGEVYNLPDYVADELLEGYATGELTRPELRVEAQALRDGKPKVEIEGDSEPKIDCPLCEGSGHISEDQRQEVLEGMWITIKE
jgi:hypothetical protein